MTLLCMNVLKKSRCYFPNIQRLYLSSINNSSIENIKKDILNVAIVGRPNTGKSTLFNRITKTRQAIVSNIPGTTRDRKEGKGYLAGLPLSLVDTGGLDSSGDGDDIDRQRQAGSDSHSQVTG